MVASPDPKFPFLFWPFVYEWGGGAGWSLSSYSKSGPPLIGSGTTAIPKQGDWIFLCTSPGRSYGILADGSLWGWGAAPLGDGTLNSYSTPTKISSGPWAWVSTHGDEGTLAVTTNGDLYAWGTNKNGVLGNGHAWGDATIRPRAFLSAGFSSVNVSSNKTPAVKRTDIATAPYVEIIKSKDDDPGSGGSLLTKCAWSVAEIKITSSAWAAYDPASPLVRVVPPAGSGDFVDATFDVEAEYAVTGVELDAGQPQPSEGDAVVFDSGISGQEARAYWRSGEFVVTSGGLYSQPPSPRLVSRSSASIKVSLSRKIKAITVADGGEYPTASLNVSAGSLVANVESLQVKVVSCAVQSSGSGYTSMASRPISARVSVFKANGEHLIKHTFGEILLAPGGVAYIENASTGLSIARINSGSVPISTNEGRGIEHAKIETIRGESFDVSDISRVSPTTLVATLSEPIFGPAALYSPRLRYRLEEFRQSVPLGSAIGPPGANAQKWNGYLSQFELLFGGGGGGLAFGQRWPQGNRNDALQWVVMDGEVSQYENSGDWYIVGKTSAGRDILGRSYPGMFGKKTSTPNGTILSPQYVPDNLIYPAGDNYLPLTTSGESTTPPPLFGFYSHNGGYGFSAEWSAYIATSGDIRVASSVASSGAGYRHEPELLLSSLAVHPVLVPLGGDFTTCAVAKGGWYAATSGGSAYAWGRRPHSLLPTVVPSPSVVSGSDVPFWGSPRPSVDGYMSPSFAGVPIENPDGVGFPSFSLFAPSAPYDPVAFSLNKSVAWINGEWLYGTRALDQIRPPDSQVAFRPFGDAAEVFASGERVYAKAGGHLWEIASASCGPYSGQTREVFSPIGDLSPPGGIAKGLDYSFDVSFTWQKKSKETEVTVYKTGIGMIPNPPEVIRTMTISTDYLEESQSQNNSSSWRTLATFYPARSFGVIVRSGGSGYFSGPLVIRVNGGRCVGSIGPDLFFNPPAVVNKKTQTLKWDSIVIPQLGAGMGIMGFSGWGQVEREDQILDKAEIGISEEFAPLLTKSSNEYKQKQSYTYKWTCRSAVDIFRLCDNGYAGANRDEDYVDFPVAYSSEDGMITSIPNILFYNISFTELPSSVEVISPEGSGATVELCAIASTTYPYCLTYKHSGNISDANPDNFLSGGMLYKIGEASPLSQSKQKGFSQLSVGAGVSASGRVYGLSYGSPSSMPKANAEFFVWQSGSGLTTLPNFYVEQPYNGTAVVDADIEGRIVGVGVVDGGSGFSSPPAIACYNRMTGLPSQDDAVAAVISGPVSHFSITNPGSGYAAPPIVTLAGRGIPGSAEATIDSQGRVTSISITDGGKYREAPSVVISPSGVVAGITLTNGGAYNSEPEVRIIGGGGAGATATCKLLRPGGPVSSVTITNKGRGYTSQPAVLFVGAGSGASAAATVGYPGSGASATAVLNGSVLYCTVQANGGVHQFSPVLVPIVTEQNNHQFKSAINSGESFANAYEATAPKLDCRISGPISSLTVLRGGYGYESPQIVTASEIRSSSGGEARIRLSVQGDGSVSLPAEFVYSRQFLQKPVLCFNDSFAIDTERVRAATRTAASVRYFNPVDPQSYLYSQLSRLGVRFTNAVISEIKNFWSDVTFTTRSGEEFRIQDIQFASSPVFLLSDDTGLGLSVQFTLSQDGYVSSASLLGTASSPYTTSSTIKLSVAEIKKSPCAAAATLSTSGGVSQITVSSGGSGYISPRVVIYGSKTGSGCEAVAIKRPGPGPQPVESIVVTSSGSGYTSPPSVYVYDESGGDFMKTEYADAINEKLASLSSLIKYGSAKPEYAAKREWPFHSSATAGEFLGMYSPLYHGEDPVMDFYATCEGVESVATDFRGSGPQYDFVESPETSSAGCFATQPVLASLLVSWARVFGRDGSFSAIRYLP